MQAQSARQYDSELLNKLALSQLAAEELIKREIKCPVFCRNLFFSVKRKNARTS